MATLSTPIQIGSHTVPNRIVMSPTVKFCLHDGSGYVPAGLAEHYRMRAKSGTGLIVVEATAPTVGGKVHHKCLGAWEDGQIEGLAEVAAAIHAEGSKAILQLCYTGVSSKDPAADKTSASPEYYARKEGLCLSHALSVEEIRAIQLAHRDAAVRAWKAGYDGVEIHCTHEKLYGRFFDSVTNHRTDGYGGSFENRARIYTETQEMIREAVPADFLVGLRIGVNLPDLDNAMGIVKAIEESKPDYFHFSKHILPAAERGDKPEGCPVHQTVYDVKALKGLVSVPVMASFKIATPEQANYVLDHDIADMVSIGRGMLADYDWAGKALRGESVDICRNCPACLWREDYHRCPAVAARGEDGMQ